GALPASTSRPRPARTLGRVRADRDAAASLQIEPLNIAVLRFGVDRRVISRVDLRIKTVASADAVPVGVHDSSPCPSTVPAAPPPPHPPPPPAPAPTAPAATAAASARLARAAPTAVILQASANVVRLSHVHSDRVELRRRDVVDELPGRGLVVADIQPTV